MYDKPEVATKPPSVTRQSVVLRVKKGRKVMCQGRPAMVLTIVSAAQIWVNFLGTQEHDWVSLEVLTPYLEQDTLNPIKPAVLVEDDLEFERAAKWVAAFDRFKGCGSALTPQAKQTIAKELGVHRRTVERHHNLYLIDSSSRGQLPCKPGPESGSNYIEKAAVAIIDKAINERYLTAERGSIQATVELAGTYCAAAGLDVPLYNTVLVRIKTLDRWKAARIRHGRVRGDATAGPAGVGLATTKLAPLEFVQMDHAILDVIVVDPDTREEIGRVWITFGIDVGTRCILGFYLTFDAPSQTSVALALEQCCCPKDGWLKDLGLKVEWIPYGLMKCIGWDNAKCFKNSNLIAGCRQAGIEPRFRRVRTPVHGAHIERFIGTYMGRVHLLKGTTFSNTKEREDYKSGDKAVMTLQELIAWTVHEICRYHNTRHSALKQTPLEAWKEAWTQDGALRLPPIPADRRKFRLSLLPSIKRTVTREGINRFGLKYWDEGLIPLIGDKHKYAVSHDPRNISQIYVFVKDDWINVPWRDRTRPPIALWEWERAKRDLRKKHNGPVSRAAVFKHIEAEREIEQKAEKSTRAQRRDRQRRPPDDRPSIAVARVDYSTQPVLLQNPLGTKHGQAA